MTLKLLALLAVAWGGQPADVSDERARLMQDACAALVLEYADSRDRLDYEAYGSLFTEDAIFEFAGQETQGRQAIVNALKERGAQMVTRHFSTPVAFEPTSHSEARGVAYLQLFRAPAGGETPHTYAEPPLIAEYHDEYHVADSNCRFKARRIKLIMSPAMK